MKKLLLFAIACLLQTLAWAQLNFSTNLRQDFSWDEATEDWILESEDEESITFFEFNEEFSMLTHTTSTITSAYKINSSLHDEEEGRNQYIFKVVSDVGNKYVMIVDIKNDNIRFVSNDGSRMVRHQIKASWLDD